MFENHYNTPQEKSFYSPTRMLSGAGVRQHVLDAASQRPSCLVIDHALLEDPFVAELHRVAALPCVVVTNEPSAEQIDVWLRQVTAAPACIVALGGGSTIDAAKAMSASYGFGTYRLQKSAVARKLVPEIVAVPTTAGSGSEATRFFVLRDHHSGRKVSYRHWDVAPSVALLDPYFLRSLTPWQRVLGAFDAFCHLWEVFICRNERSPFTDELALTGMTTILSLLPKIAKADGLSEAELAQLQYSAWLGGMAIANVRTGMIHTCGESLAAQIALPHAATLAVFFAPVLLHYEVGVADRWHVLRERIQQSWQVLGDLVAAWQQLWRTVGVEQEIARALAAAKIDVEVLLADVQRDTVLLKEHPIPFDAGLLQTILKDALKQWQ